MYVRVKQNECEIWSYEAMKHPKYKKLEQKKKVRIDNLSEYSREQITSQL